MDKQKLYTEIIENYVSAYNAFDIGGMVKDLSEQVVFENRSNGIVNLRTEGVRAFTEQAEAALSYFTEREQRIQSWEFSDDTVTICIGYHATLALDFPNGLKAGDVLALEGTSEFEFLAGKIVRITDKS